MAKLLFQGDRFAGRVYELVGEVTRVGRGPHNELVIDDKSVSADHCEILVYGTEVIVRDHGSTNGCFVDGVRVVGQRPAQSGQVIRWGGVEACLELSSEDEFDTEDATSNTAVHFQRRWVHDASPPLPQSPPPAATPPPDPSPGEATVQIRRTAAEERPAPIDVAPEESPARLRRRLVRARAVVVGLVILALVLAALAVRWLR